MSDGVRDGTSDGTSGEQRAGEDPVLRPVARLLIGPAVVVAACYVVKSYADVGDGFAGGVLVALALALFPIAYGRDAGRLLPAARYAPRVAVAGLSLSLAVGFWPVLVGEPPFSHRPAPGEEVATIGTLELFTPFLFDTGVCLLVVGSLTVLVRQFARPFEDASR